MDRIFNFRQSRELLRVDPKTFQEWLQKAEIDANKQVNLADSRERYLTEEQLTLLAKQHGRTLPPLNSQPELPATVTPAMLAEQESRSPVVLAGYSGVVRFFRVASRAK